LAAAARLSASYARALVAEFHVRTRAGLEGNGHRPAPVSSARQLEHDRRRAGRPPGVAVEHASTPHAPYPRVS